MTNEFKQFHTYDVNEIDLENIKWDTFKPFQLFQFAYDDAKIQIYPYTILKYHVNHHDLKEYDRRCDGKRYFSASIADNGFTPKHSIGTVRGNVQRFFDIVDSIVEYKESLIFDKMNDVLSSFKYRNKSCVDFDFCDWDEACVYVDEPSIMEEEDEILEESLRVFDEFGVNVSYEWNYDAGDEYSRLCKLDFEILKDF